MVTKGSKGTRSVLLRGVKGKQPGRIGAYITSVMTSWECWSGTSPVCVSQMGRTGVIPCSTSCSDGFST